MYQKIILAAFIDIPSYMAAHVEQYFLINPVLSGTSFKYAINQGIKLLFQFTASINCVVRCH